VLDVACGDGSFSGNYYSQSAAHVDAFDIEGAEFRALVGAKECFLRYKPVLFLATHGREVHDDCCRLLHSWHYELRTVEQSAPDRSELVACSRAARAA